MGISNVMIHWFERLHRKGAFAGKRSILDLGPQDLVTSEAVVANFVAGVAGRAPDPAEIRRTFFGENGHPRPDAMRPFYAACGLTEYAALDLADPRAEYRVDLNDSVRLDRRFDVITNFGTLEHVFNVANVLATMHEHLEPGGLALHVLPTRGDYNHGFYNIHSTFFRDLAAANGYAVIDLVNVPDFGGQHVAVGRNEKLGDRPPRPSILTDISRTDDDGREEAFARTVAWRLFRRRWFDKTIDPRVYDYIFAAFRKTSDGKFVMPQQGTFARC
jgi:SAM-dependent methyltransferase